MKSAIAVSLMGLCVAMSVQPASAGEGRVSDQPVVLEEGRVARYARGASEPTSSTKSATGSTPSSKTHSNNKVVQGKIMRAPSAALSTSANHLYIYDAGSLLLSDRDRDGYHNEFRIRFDADSRVGDVLVYARLYIRRVGDVDWQLYRTTDDFWIYGQSEDDDYFVTTSLDDGFATGEYDILIDLYEVGFSDIVATIGPDESGALRDLPLEEFGLDVPIEIPGYSMRGVSTTLMVDSDRDGHYSSFRISFDPDADFDGTYVYAKFWVRAPGDEWIEEFVSEDFLVDAAGTEDVYTLTADWVSGYPTAYYDVQIDLHDAATGALVASAGSERPELSRIPLEDQSRDTRVNPPSTGGGGGDTSSSESGGGGAFTLWSLLALLLLALERRVRSALRR